MVVDRPLKDLDNTLPATSAILDLGDPLQPLLELFVFQTERKLPYGSFLFVELHGLGHRGSQGLPGAPEGLSKTFLFKILLWVGSFN